MWYTCMDNEPSTNPRKDSVGKAKRTHLFISIRISLPKDEELRRLLVLQIVPFMCPVMVHLYVLGDVRLEYQVCGHQMIRLDACSVVECDLPVSQGFT